MNEVKEKLKVLIISTYPPSYSSGLGKDLVLALEYIGCEVDYLCRYEESNIDYSFKVINTEHQYNFRRITRYLSKLEKPLYLERIYQRSLKLLKRIYYTIKPHKLANVKSLDKEGISIHYYDERTPYTPTSTLKNKIISDYNFIITLFWHKFINSTTLKKLYDTYNIPILVWAIDMAPMTGGCQYFKDCRNFESQCGRCPALNSNNPKDQTHKNYLIKKQNYEQMKVAFIGNSWINEFAKRSKLFREDQIFNISCIIDENAFFPVSKDYIKQKLGLQQPIILLIRSSGEARKGCSIAIEALKRLVIELPSNTKQKILLITVGDDTIEKSLREYDIKIQNRGLVDRNTLINLYQAATYFLSPSIDDAGPSMVNQAMMCGTPVISFNNGTAIDVIEDQVNGYKTSNISIEGYLNLMSKAIALSETELYQDMCTKARMTSLHHNSKIAIATKLINTYRSVNSK